MKKILSLMMMILLIASLSACKKDNGNDKTDKIDLNGQEIVILHGALNEVDPSLPTFTGKYKEEKLALMRAVEKKYNCKITYKLYDDSAPWGTQRADAIIKGVIAKQPIGHILAISTDWIPQLVNGKGIVSISDYDKEFGSKDFSQSVKDYSSYKGQLYGFETGRIYNDRGFFYNISMIERMGLEDPAKLWNEGKWTWAKFEEYVTKQVVPRLSEDEYALSGSPAILAQHFVGSNGGYLLDPITYKVDLTNTVTVKSIEFLNKIYNYKNVYDPQYGGDVSPAFTKGKVVFHFGELWFVTADNRFGNRSFKEIGFVPLPAGPDIKSDLSNYQIGLPRTSVWAISAGFEKSKFPVDNKTQITDEILYRIWTEMQFWIPEDEQDFELEMALKSKGLQGDSLTAYMSIRNNTYKEQILNFMNAYSSGLDTGLVKAVKSGNVRSEMQALQEKLQVFVDELLNQ